MAGYVMRREENLEKHMVKRKRGERRPNMWWKDAMRKEGPREYRGKNVRDWQGEMVNENYQAHNLLPTSDDGRI